MKNFYFFRSVPVLALFLLLPAVSVAQGVGDIFGFTGLLYSILIRVGELLWVLAVMLFIWGVVKFIANADDTAERAAGKQFMVWGIISFVVLLSLWAIVDIILSGTFGIMPGGEIPYIDKNS